MSRHYRVILIQSEAPPKPALGQPCNGCGLCCLAEPCPVGALLSLKLRGTCRLLSWDSEQRRYLCGALMAAPTGWPRRLMSRWIAAGVGCDAELESAPGKP
ncbi:hypothetical protein [Pelomonas sp. SE-A7]|uniref:hypothetical protein n=1 Tax=Pelomonas sp. SE-A7 TaxID=3054953 RepID=UPI00259CDDE4|nr:hypothetical protein [Pelomonas sp. SE-A7]MDM4767408.1 hypothetical protein [Pelomonas sp. SE-A7]